MGQQTKAGFTTPKGIFGAVVNQVVNPAKDVKDVKAQQEKQETDKGALIAEWEKARAKNEQLKNKKVSFNPDDTTGDMI